MYSRDARRVVAELSESQWGMFTSAQAVDRGVSHMNLARLTESGDVLRLSHGIYRDAGAPSDEHEALRAAWLAADPKRLVWERLQQTPPLFVVSGESAADLHSFGDLRATRSEFTTPERKQTQRTDVRYRTRTLRSEDVTVRRGLPVTSVERTIADLVDDRVQVDHIGIVLRDAIRTTRVDVERLAELLSPLARRNGHAAGDGAALLEDLLGVAQLDAHALSRKIAEVPDLGALVSREYLESFARSAAAGLAALESPAMRSAMEVQKALIADLSAAIERISTPQISGLENLRKVINGAALASAALSLNLPKVIPVQMSGGRRENTRNGVESSSGKSDHGVSGS